MNNTIEEFESGGTEYHIERRADQRKRLVRYAAGENAKCTQWMEDLWLKGEGDFRTILQATNMHGEGSEMWLDSDGDVAVDGRFLTSDQIDEMFQTYTDDSVREQEASYDNMNDNDTEEAETTDLAVPTENGLENVMEVDLDEDFDETLGRFLMEREYYHDGVKNEPPKLEAKIIDANMDLNRQKEIWVEFETPTGRTIEEFFNKPTLTDTFESNVFLKLLEVISVSGYEPDEMKGEKVPLQVDEDGEFFDVLIETDEERLDRLHEEAKMEHEPLSGESISQTEVVTPSRREKVANGAMSVVQRGDQMLANHPGPSAVIYFSVAFVILASTAMSVPFPAQVPINVFGGTGLLVFMLFIGSLYEERYN